MRGASLRRLGLCLALAALVACGLKGDPEPPQPQAQREAEGR